MMIKALVGPHPYLGPCPCLIKWGGGGGRGSIAAKGGVAPQRTPGRSQLASSCRCSQGGCALTCWWSSIEHCVARAAASCRFSEYVASISAAMAAAFCSWRIFSPIDFDLDIRARCSRRHGKPRGGARGSGRGRGRKGGVTRGAWCVGTRRPVPSTGTCNTARQAAAHTRARQRTGGCCTWTGGRPRQTTGRAPVPQRPNYALPRGGQGCPRGLEARRHKGLRVQKPALTPSRAPRG